MRDQVGNRGQGAVPDGLEKNLISRLGKHGFESLTITGAIGSMVFGCSFWN